MVLIASVILTSAPGMAGNQLSPEVFLALLKDCKCILKHMRKGFSIQGPEDYPQTPSQFEETHNKLWRLAYEDAQAVECKVNVEELLKVARTMPARKTHHSVSSSAPAVAYRTVPGQGTAPFTNIEAAASNMMSVFIQHV
jgi:hypothetical protein